MRKVVWEISGEVGDEEIYEICGDYEQLFLSVMGYLVQGFKKLTIERVEYDDEEPQVDPRYPGYLDDPEEYTSGIVVHEV